MLLKRHIPLLIVITVGLVTLFGHFINNESIQSFVDKDALQWFDIIASFAVFLGALNMLKLQVIKIIKKQKNWQYSILAVVGFAFAIFSGFFYRGANFITLSDVKEGQLAVVSQIIAEELNETNPHSIQTTLETSNAKYEIDKMLPIIMIIMEKKPIEGKKCIGSKSALSILPKLIRATPQLKVCLKNNFNEVRLLW